ncbi:kinase-like protein [Macrolepiota fuliginosa MF-IS2]|uniref:Kinase-like protein n=1 Tax=Macrolepiota fuliginosa MF-IS2 TaxID=1400762 RepID=A0A9P5XPL1_9AGAR|nr:kinase-like protein [Macrolepiota fuliginosa MF-IS2]
MSRLPGGPTGLPTLLYDEVETSSLVGPKDEGSSFSGSSWYTPPPYTPGWGVESVDLPGPWGSNHLGPSETSWGVTPQPSAFPSVPWPPHSSPPIKTTLPPPPEIQVSSSAVNPARAKTRTPMNTLSKARLSHAPYRTRGLGSKTVFAAGINKEPGPLAFQGVFHSGDVEPELGNKSTFHAPSAIAPHLPPSSVHKIHSSGANFSMSTSRMEELDGPDARRELRTKAAIALVRGILYHKASYKALLKLRGSDAQRLLDCLQKLLHSPQLHDANLRSHLLSASLRLCNASDMYPACLTLRGLECEANPVTAGQFGEIRRGRVRGRLVCVKVVKLYERAQIDHLIKKFMLEAIVWSLLSHPYLLPFYGICRLGDGVGRACLISPWMERGNICEYIKKNPGTPRMSLVHDIVHGLAYLHTLKIAHGDLKGTNIMVTSTGSACLADFGLSSVVDADILRWTSLETATQVGGTARWMAPELFDDERGEMVRPTTAGDIYALASVMYEVLTDRIPFHEYPSNITVMFKVASGQRPSKPLADVLITLELTDEIWNLMHRCWSSDPLGRPKAKDALEILQGIPINSLSRQRLQDTRAEGTGGSDTELLSFVSFRGTTSPDGDMNVDDDDVHLLRALHAHVDPVPESHMRVSSLPSETLTMSPQTPFHAPTHTGNHIQQFSGGLRPESHEYPMGDGYSSRRIQRAPSPPSLRVAPPDLHAAWYAFMAQFDQ